MGRGMCTYLNAGVRERAQLVPIEHSAFHGVGNRGVLSADPAGHGVDGGTVSRSRHPQ